MLKVVEDEIKSISKRVISMTFYDATRDECLDVPDYIAYEILDLVEIMAPNFTYHDQVISEILKYDGLSDKTKQIIRELR